MKTIFKSIAAAFFTIFFMNVATAGPGTISGTILDDSNGEPLIGANVYVEEKMTGTSTDFDGKYQFNVEPGTYTIVISYTGYTEKRITEVVVKEDEITYLDVTLTDSSIDLVQVEVTAKVIERTENALLLLQRRSEKIQDGISSQEISRFAVSDAAGAMQKVTGASVQGGKYVYIRGLGDRYSLSQINGIIIPSTDPYRNSVALDLIPASLLDNIITYKTFTPDQPGSFTGGNVDIKTKSFPEQFFLNISASVDYNSQNNLINNFLTHQGGALDYFGYDDGSRALPDIFTPENRLRLNQNTELDARFGDKEAAYLLDSTSLGMNRQFQPGQKSTFLDHSYGLSLGNQFNLFGRPLGMIFSASYQQSYSYLGGFTKGNWVLQDLASPELSNQGDFSDTLAVENPRVNGLVGLAYKLSPLHQIDFLMIYNHNTEKSSRSLFGERPDNIIYPDLLEGRSLSFIQRQMINYQLGGTHSFGSGGFQLEWKGSVADSRMDEPMTRFFENQLNIETGDYTLPLSNIQRPFYFFRELKDKQYAGKLDLTIPFTQNKANKIKVGGMFTQKDRDFLEDRFQFVDNQFADRFQGDPNEFLGDDNVGIVDIDDQRQRYYIGNYVTDVTVKDNSYTGYEKVYAGYAMLTLQVLPKLKFVGGARYEQTDIFVESAATNRPDSLRIGTIDVGDILPAGSLIFSLRENMNLRGSYARTVARPNLREIAPFVSFDPLEKFFYNGNTQLRRTLVDNFDLRWEWFLSPGELVAVSGYYKKFDDPIALQYIRSSNPEVKYSNVESADLLGIELELRKNLGFIGGFLQNFYFNGNFSVINSTMDVIDVTGLEPDNRPFEGQAPYIVNATLNYIQNELGLDASLTFNVIGDKLDLIGREGTPDIYDRSRTQLDFVLIKRFGNLNLRFRAQNLTNAPFVRSSDFNGKEFVYSKFRRGMRFGLGFSYTIR